MAAGRSIKAGAAYVELFTRDSKFVRGLARAQRRLQMFGQSVRNVGMRMMAIGGAISAPLILSTRHFIKAGDQLDKMNKRTGLSVRFLSEMAFAAQQSGADIDALGKGAKGMAQFMLQAERGTKQYLDVLEMMGLTLGDLQGKSPDEQFMKLAAAVSRVEDPTRRAGLAMQVFGRAGQGLLPLLAEGPSGIVKLRNEARALGLSIGPAQARAAAALTDAWARVTSTFKGVAFQIGAALAPSLIKLSNQAAKWIARAIDWVKHNKNLIVTVAKLAAATVAGGAALVALSYVFSGMAMTLGGVGAAITGLATVVGILGTVLAAVLSPVGLLVAGLVAATAAFLYFSGTGQKVLDGLAAIFGKLKDIAGETIAGIVDALKAGDMALAAKIGMAGLKVAWMEGVFELKKIWIDFKTWLAKAVAETITGAKVNWREPFAATLNQAITMAAGSFGQTAIVGGVKARVTKWAKAPITGRAAGERAAGIGGQHAAQLRELERDRQRALAAAHEGADAARAELAGLAGQAKDELQAGRLMDLMRRKGGALGGGLWGALKTVGRAAAGAGQAVVADVIGKSLATASEAKGLFNIAGMQSLVAGGRRSVEDKQLDALQNMDENIETLVKKARPLTFTDDV